MPRTAERVQKELDGADVLINNAGVCSWLQGANATIGATSGCGSSPNSSTE
jgi:NAD(P)-dependent dehydrogenase (short-subunit alcohol dehydrogenase family)